MAKELVYLTEAAAGRLKALTERGGGRVVRLTVKASGCSGYRYDLDYADAPGPNDEPVSAHGATLYVDPLSILYVAGMTIDWHEDRLERRFVFDNPNEGGRCGCGDSFHL
jgi:Iron-sulfur cluster assembly accessory protein